MKAARQWLICSSSIACMLVYLFSESVEEDSESVVEDTLWSCKRIYQLSC